MRDSDIPAALIVVWVVMAVISIVVTGVAIWGIVELVQWIIDGGLAAAIHGKP